MAKSTIIPLGKHKGRDITLMSHSEVHILWSAWNSHGHLKKHVFFQVILSELGRWTQKKAEAGKSRAADVGRMPFGKYQGRLISDLPQDYLEWAAENIKGNIVVKLRDERQRRTDSGSAASAIKEPKKAKKRDRAIPDDSVTHYRWEDRTGKVHMITNDVDMDGRENEECPFDASVAVIESEPMGELDREFRAMFR